MKYEDLHPQIMMWCQDCPAIAVQEALARAVRDFCAGSKALVRVIDIELAAQEQDLFIAAPPGFDVVGAESASFAGSAITCIDAGEPLIATNRLGKFVLVNAPLRRAYIGFSPIGGENLSIALAVMPSLSVADSADFPHELDRFSDAIASGAAGRLMLQPSKPWSNPQLAAPLLQDFNEKKSTANALVGLAGLRKNKPRCNYF